MNIKNIKPFLSKHRIAIILAISGVLVGSSVIYFLQATQNSHTVVLGLTKEKQQLQQQLTSTQQQFDAFKSQDQVKRNDALQQEIDQIHKTYAQAVDSYQTLLDLKVQKVKSDTYDAELAQSLKYLSDRNYASAEAILITLTQEMKKEQATLAADAAAAAISQTSTSQTSQAALTSNTAPSNGFSRQKVHSDIGDFVVDIIAADLNSTRVIVDTASDGDCKDTCPVLPLSDYVSRNGAFAGINGTYFCPTAYPQCAGKTNSFDLLVMNKNRHYINSDNNVYSTNPAMIFGGNWSRLVGQASGWGRDTSVDAVISNYPLLVSGGSIAYGGGSDPKMGSKGTRCFIGGTGNTAYIGIVYNATMTESAHVLKELGISNAMNLDEGGSTALWYGGYKAGPGRNIPNAVLFVHK